jgi:hypothetical protein
MGTPETRLSDDDVATARRARFGKLPTRIAAEDRVEETDTDQPAHELEQSITIVQHPGRINVT